MEITRLILLIYRSIFSSTLLIQTVINFLYCEIEVKQNFVQNLLLITFVEQMLVNISGFCASFNKTNFMLLISSSLLLLLVHFNINKGQVCVFLILTNTSGFQKRELIASKHMGNFRFFFNKVTGFLIVKRRVVIPTETFTFFFVKNVQHILKQRLGIRSKVEFCKKFL